VGFLSPGETKQDTKQEEGKRKGRSPCGQAGKLGCPTGTPSWERRTSTRQHARAQSVDQTLCFRQKNWTFKS